MGDERYDIIRMFFSDDYDTFVVKRNVTLEEAQAHCSDPETSSRSGTSDWVKAYTEKYGDWFDGYEQVGRTREARRAPVLT